MRRAETKAINLQVYAVMQLGLTVEAGTGRDEAGPPGTPMHKKLRKKLMFKVVLAVKISLRTMNYVAV